MERVRRRWLLLGVAGWACGAQERSADDRGVEPPVEEPSAEPTASPPPARVASAEAPGPRGAPPREAASSDPAPRKESRHHLDVPRAHMEAGASRSYTVFGDGHSHPITIDEAAMAKLKSAGFALVQCGLGGPDKPHRHWCVVHVA